MTKILFKSTAAIALVAALAFSPASVQAGQANNQQVNPRDFQAFGYTLHEGEGRDLWRKANGGEILGSFYGADDEVNDRTGEIRRR
jgi:hypothetical protein